LQTDKWPFEESDKRNERAAFDPTRYKCWIFLFASECRLLHKRKAHFMREIPMINEQLGVNKMAKKQ